MAKEKLFWLGDGVFTIGGKEYGTETSLPTDEINPDDLKKMKSDGRIGAKIAVIDDTEKALIVLQARIAELEVLLEEATKPKDKKK